MGEEDRRVQPYCNTDGWDSKTVLTVLTLFLATGGSILASWLSLNTQLTTLQVTQDIKFKIVEQHVLSDAQKEARINARLESLESTVESMMYRQNSQSNSQSKQK